MTKPEIYVSIDIESNGPCPGVYSMLSLGAAAFAADGEQLDTWYFTLEPLHGAMEHPDTMAWWKTQPEAWAEVNTSQWDPEIAIGLFAEWVEALPGKPRAAAWPAGFDFPFVLYYLHRFAGRNPLGIACIDIRSYANGLAGMPGYYNMPDAMMQDLTRHVGYVGTSDLRDHVALDDAIGQGRLLMALIAHAQRVQDDRTPGGLDGAFARLGRRFDAEDGRS
jgi:hypothetical protein